jgi:ATP-dependent DNA ligase
MTAPLTPHEAALRYRRAVASRYRALKPEELSELPPGPVQLSPKIDGELWFAVLEGGRASLVAPNGRTLDASAPLLSELATAAERVGAGRTILAGELFAAGGKPRPRVGEVGTALAAGGVALDRLGWQAFDVVELDDGPPPATLEARTEALSRLLGGGRRATPVKTVTTADKAEIAAQWEVWGASGKSEGMIARVADGRVFKVKPGFSLDAAVVGFTTRAEDVSQARSLVFAVLRPDGTFQLVGSVGNLGTDDARRALLAEVLPRECPSGFRHTSGDGTLVRWVRPEVVIEVASTDVQAEDSDGAPVERWALRFDGGAWSPVAAMPGASLIHPVLARVRRDKAVNSVDVRAAQLTERCVLNALEAPAEATALPASALVRREVWTKAAKGKTAVRKLLVWRTNKETAVPGWPAWVVHFTDYSPDRKTPLERTVRPAVSEAHAQLVADALVAENIKKGWERSGPAT